MNTARIYLLETKYELLKLLRIPGKIAPLVLFPCLFYAVFGVAMSSARSPLHMPSYLLATYGAFGMMGAALMGISVGLSVERALGWLAVKRASPMPGGANLIARIATGIALGLTTFTVLFVVGAGFGGVRLSPLSVLSLAAILAYGAIPFCALGIALGYFISAQSVHAVVNLCYLPMAFLTGLWLPLQFLPKMMRTIAPALPSYHLGQAALLVIGQPAEGTLPAHLAALAAFTLIFTGAAWLGYRRDESR